MRNPFHLPKRQPVALQQRLVSLLVLIFAALTLVQLFMAGLWIRSRFEQENAGNEEFARAVAIAFSSFVRDVAREEAVLGLMFLDIRPLSLAQMDELLRLSLDQHRAVKRFFFVDTTGRIVAGDRSLKRIDVGPAPFFRALSTHRDSSVYLGDLEPLLLETGPGFVVARAVRTPAGELRAIVAAFVDPTELADIALNIDRPANGVFTLFDSKGRLVFVSDREQLAAELRQSWIEHDPVLRRARAGGDAVGLFRSPVDNRLRVAARVHIRDTGWTAGAARPLADIVLPLVGQIALVLLLTALVSVLGLVAGLAGVRTVVRSLERMRAHADALARGDFSRISGRSGISDFDLLADDLNRMAEQIKERDQRLRVRSEELERSNKELEQFAYVASHDLQEPLRTIAGYIQLISQRYQGRLDKDADEFIGFAVQGVHRLQAIINDLLTFSRVGTRGKPFVPIDVGRVLDGVVAAMRTTIETNQADVSWGAMPVVSADATQLSQLFQNLVSNAIKFRGQGPPRVRIEAQKRGGEWVFSVKDNGIGIAQEYFDRIFIAFKRLHTQEEYPGTGIGLAISRKIVERHHGRIWVESAPALGSTFYFTIPERSEKRT